MTHDEEQEPQVVHVVYPAHELRWEDFVGYGLNMIAEVHIAIYRGFAAAGNDFFAAARFQRAWTREIARQEHLDNEFNGIISQPVLTEEPGEDA